MTTFKIWEGKSQIMHSGKVHILDALWKMDMEGRLFYGATLYPHATPLFWTGKRDRNDHKIYQGDIVKSHLGTRAKVVYDGTQFLLKRFDRKSGTWKRMSWMYADYVIGNIFQTPELLEEC